MKNWFNKFIVWLFPSDEVEYIGLTDKESSGFVNVATLTKKRKTFAQLFKKARGTFHYEMEGAMLALTEDKNEAPLLELVESLRAQLAIVTEDRDRLRFESIFMSEYNSTCAHHTYEERKIGCPVCLKRKLEESEKNRTEAEHIVEWIKTHFQANGLTNEFSRDDAVYIYGIHHALMAAYHDVKKYVECNAGLEKEIVELRTRAETAEKDTNQERHTP